LPALLDAVVAIGSDLELPNVLDRIVRCACELTGAAYGALGVLDDDRTGLAEFVTHGLAPGVREQLGDPPSGRGLLGVLIEDPTPLRLSRLQDHEASYGFPPGHPPMTTFLGVPLLVRGTVFGNLYLTGKAEGAPFTEEDEQLVLALASAAGVVIENARAYRNSEQQRAWLEASTRLNEVLQPPIDIGAAIQHVAVATRELSASRAVGIFRLDETDTPRLLVADGRDADRLATLARPLARQITDAEWSGRTATTGVDGTVALVVPLRTHLVGSGALVALFEPDGVRADGELVMSFVDQACLALDRVQAVADREAHIVGTDRDRIARDLHDLVIQRLFATGLQLQGIRAKAVLPEVQQRVDQAIEDLDMTIRDIRSTIYELQQGTGPSLRAEVQSLTREYAPALGFTPATRTRGPVDTIVPEEIGSQLLAVLREALSNVAKHADAATVIVEVEADATDVLLRVTDDGRGLPSERHESGLVNLRRRADEQSGTLRLLPAQPRGTVLEWRVPLPPG
jgi:signal transduction histidine kinase